jgi:serine/threonine protein kinase
MEVPVSPTELLSLSGNMKIRPNSGKLWRNCHFYLIAGQLQVYTDSSRKDLVQAIDIGSRTQVDVDEGDEYTEFVVKEDGLYRMECMAPSAQDARKWVKVLCAFFTPPIRLCMDDFSILSVLGRGYFGKVMLVEKRDTKELFAIKSVRKTKLRQSRGKESILAERNVLMIVKNPFIVQLHFAFQTSSKFYLGLEYAPGGELYCRMQREGAIPIDDCRLIAAEIALALHHLHQFGIIYRDLKPENICFDEDGHVKLTDFGLAKDLCDEERTNTICGTDKYLAPEIVVGFSYSYDVDWWALGVLLCEMLTGVVPFSGDTPKTLYESIIKDEPMVPYGIDRDARMLILGLLKKDPNLRFNFETICGDAFFAEFNWKDVHER